MRLFARLALLASLLLALPALACAEVQMAGLWRASLYGSQLSASIEQDGNAVKGEVVVCALTGENRERRALRGNRVVLKRRTGTIYAAETLSEIYSLDEETLRQNFNLIVHSWDAN